MQERWMADRAMLYRLMKLHPEWTQNKETKEAPTIL